MAILRPVWIAFSGEGAWGREIPMSEFVPAYMAPTDFEKSVEEEVTAYFLRDFLFKPLTAHQKYFGPLEWTWSWGEKESVVLMDHSQIAPQTILVPELIQIMGTDGLIMFHKLYPWTGAWTVKVT